MKPSPSLSLRKGQATPGSKALIHVNPIENQPLLLHFSAQKIRDCIRVKQLL